MSRHLRLGIDAGMTLGLVLALWAVYRLDRGREGIPVKEQGSDALKISTEQETQVQETPPEPLRLAVTPASFDDMGRLLKTLGVGYAYTTIDEAKLEDPAALERVDVLFLTCAETGAAAASSKLPQALRKFVGRGGTLYASDLRFDTLAEAFPEAVDATAVAQGKKQDLQAEVLDAGLRELVGDSLPLHFDLDGWRPAAFGGRTVTAYLRGEFQTTAGVSITSPLLVKFPFQDGTVVFTAFHNEKQNNENEIKLLKHLVLTTITAKVETRVTKTMISGGFSPQQQNLLSATPDNPSVTQTYQHSAQGDLQFALGFERRGAQLRLRVAGPDGTRRDEVGAATLTINVPQAATGAWQYTVTAEKLPYPNFPFTLTVGAVSKDAAKLAQKPPAELREGEPSGTARLNTGGTLIFTEIKLAKQITTKRWRIAVTPPEFDDMGALLDKLGEGFRYENIDSVSDPSTLERYDVLFLTCSSGAGTPVERDNLRRFVERGGTLYASDLRYTLVATAFPDFIRGEEKTDEPKPDADMVEAEQALKRLEEQFNGTQVESLQESLQPAGLSPELAAEIEKISASLQTAKLADNASPPTAAIRKVLVEAGFPSVSDADVNAIVKAVRGRALKINRTKREGRKDKDLAAQLAAARLQVTQLQARGSRPAVFRTGKVQNLTAQVVDAGLREVLGPSMDLNFEAGGWAPAQFGSPNVKVYLRGKYQATQGGQFDAPLLVKFTAGAGTVLFTSFHNEAQNSAQEEKLLRYLVFTAVTAKEEALVAKTMVSGGFSPTSKDLLSHSSGNPTITRTYRNSKPGRLQFALGVSGEDARLVLKIVAPNGQVYEKETRQTLIVEVPEAPLGEWRYTVTALEVPYENFPFTVDIGEGTTQTTP